MTQRFAAVLVAAGKGQRMQADRPKQYLPYWASLFWPTP